MYYFIYETTNLINNKKYRGMHQTQIIDDGYLGSGSSLKRSVKKYGKENFTRKILEFCESYDILIEKEKIYVDVHWVNNNSNYNLKTGGQSVGILSEESRKKISDSHKKRYENGAIGNNKGKTVSEETKKKISETLKDKYKDGHPSKGKPCSSGRKGRIPWNKDIKTGPESEETKLKKSEASKKYYETHNGPWKGKEPPNKGITGQVAWNKGVVMEKVECPYCGKMSDISNGKRWHFDNCKFKK